jgi:hypothetical protein
MTAIDKFSLGFLLIIFLIQLFKRDLLKKISFVWVFVILGIFSAGIFYSIKQYLLWQNDPFAKFFIPPYRNISYFLQFVGLKFFAPWLLALAMALVFYFVALWANKKYDERFFENEEIPMASLGFFLSGWPGFLFYLILILICGLILTLFYTLKNKGRAPFYYFWIILAILVNILKFVLPKSLLNFFVIS